jgi:hypothetical protein
VLSGLITLTRLSKLNSSNSVLYRADVRSFIEWVAVKSVASHLLRHSARFCFFQDFRDLRKTLPLTIGPIDRELLQQHVEAKIRQSLQILRDRGRIAFDGNGRYRKRLADVRPSVHLNFGEAAATSRSQVACASDFTDSKRGAEVVSSQNAAISRQDRAVSGS